MLYCCSLYFTILYSIVSFGFCVCVHFSLQHYFILCYFMLCCIYIYFVKKKSILSTCYEIVSTWACEFFYFHCLGGCVADTTISAMEVVSSVPVPIIRLAHRATDLVKDQGLWVDVKFLHANNPGKQVLQHGSKWMSPFFLRHWKVQ